MADVAQYGLDALAHIRKNVSANLDITQGLLFGIDSNGKAVLADAATGVRAVGVVVDGSDESWGSALAFNKTSTLYEGRDTDVNKFAIIDVAENTYTNLQIGNKVYLGASGAFTTTQNTTLGQLDQWVGMVWSRSSVLINLTLDPVGTTNAAGNFDIVRYSADGAIATAGIALVDGGTGIAGLTLGAPSAGTYVEIILDTITSGTVVVTTGTGITYDGTNNTATFNAAADFIRLGYKSATEWEVIENNSVVFSLV